MYITCGRCCQVNFFATIGVNTQEVRAFVLRRNVLVVRLRIRELAEKQGFNISSLSRKADVSQNTIRRLWHDPYRQVEISVLERIARVLGVATGDLLEDVPD